MNLYQSSSSYQPLGFSRGKAGTFRTIHSFFSFFNLSVALGGDFVVDGTTITLDNAIQTTEQLTVINNGTGPALMVDQKGDEMVAQFKKKFQKSKSYTFPR